MENHHFTRNIIHFSNEHKNEQKLADEKLERIHNFTHINTWIFEKWFNVHSNADPKIWFIFAKNIRNSISYHEYRKLYTMSLKIGFTKTYETAQTSILTLNWRFVFGAVQHDWLLILAFQMTFNVHYFFFVVLVLVINQERKSIPLNKYWKSLAILEKASIFLKRSSKIVEIFIKVPHF
jgi:hypothetical protein